MQSRDLDAKQFKWLLGVSHSLMTTLEFKAVARLSCSSLMELFPYDRVSLWLRPNDGTKLKSLISVYQDGSESHYEAERLTDWLQSLMGQRQEVLIYREDLGEHRPHLKQLNKVDADIAHAFPLYINEDPVGILYADVRHAMSTLSHKLSGDGSLPLRAHCRCASQCAPLRTLDARPSYRTTQQQLSPAGIGRTSRNRAP